jgi:hypothetical protein
MATEPTEGRSVPLVERVKNILMTPKTEWPRIDAEPATIGGIYRSYVVILAAIPPICLLIGLMIFGMPGLGSLIQFSPGYLIGQAILTYLLSLGSVYVLALIIEALAPTFGGQKDRVSAFKVAAYSSTAAWVVGIFYLVPFLAILGILGLYSLYLLYLGLPVLMKVPADKAVGYVVAVIVASIILYLIVGTIAGRMMTTMMPAQAPSSITVNLPG